MSTRNENLLFRRNANYGAGISISNNNIMKGDRLTRLVVCRNSLVLLFIYAHQSLWRFNTNPVIACFLKCDQAVKKLIGNTSTYIQKILSFSIEVGRDHFFLLVTILTHTFRFYDFRQILHIRSPVSGTFDLSFL
jgi:hypothetical protein